MQGHGAFGIVNGFLRKYLYNCVAYKYWRFEYEEKNFVWKHAGDYMYVAFAFNKCITNR